LIFIAPSGAAVQVPTSSVPYSFIPTLVRDFYQNIVPDKLDKVRVFDMILLTQAARIKTAGDKRRAQCIEKKLFVGTDVPEAFQTGIIQELFAAYKSESSTVSVESIFMNAIEKNCGNKGK